MIDGERAGRSWLDPVNLEANMKRQIGLAVMTAIVTMAAVAAQSKPDVKLPASPRGLAAVQVGGSWSTVDGEQRYSNGSWITVDYGRPILRGRQNIFGSGASYGKLVNPDSALWRAGANDTTRLTTQVPLVIGGTTIQPGVYNMFVDLKEGAWTLVLSTQPVQPKYDATDKVNLYGAYNYDKKFDVLRAPMRLATSPSSLEQFTINFVDVTNSRITLTMAWDRTVAAIDFMIK
jgi:hypothetical protein